MNCPVCGAKAEVHEEQLGRRVVQVVPARCKNCGWIEGESLKTSRFLNRAELKHHEVEYIKFNEESAFLKFANEFLN